MFSFNTIPSAKDGQPPLIPVPKKALPPSRGLGKTGRRVDHFPEDTLYSDEEDYSDDYEYDTFDDASLSTKSNNTNAPPTSNASAPPPNICHPAPNRPLEPHTNTREDLIALSNYFGFARGDVVRHQQEQRAQQVVRNLPPVQNQAFALDTMNQAAIQQQHEKELFLQLQTRAQGAVTAYGNAMLTEFSAHRVVDPCRVMLQFIFAAAQACQAMPAFETNPDIHDFMGALSQRILLAKKSLDDGKVEEEVDILELENSRTSRPTGKGATARAKAPTKSTAKTTSKKKEAPDDESEYRAAGRGARGGRGSRGGGRGGAVRSTGRKRTTLKLNDASTSASDEENESALEKVATSKPHSGAKNVFLLDDDESDDNDAPKKVSHAKSKAKPKAPPKRGAKKKANSSSSDSDESLPGMPGPPKKPMNAFLAFVEEKRPEFQTNFPEASFAELTKMMGNAWKNFAEEDRTVYRQRSDADRDRYAREFQLWQCSQEKAKMPVKAKGKKCDSSSSSTSDSEDDVPTKKKATPVKSAKSKVGSKERKPLAQKASRKHDAKATSSEEEKAPKEKLAAPLRAMSAYMIYMNAKRPEFKERNPDANLPELSRLMGAAWKDLSFEEKETYVVQANADRERYNRENALWEASHASKSKASNKKIALESDSEDDSDEGSSSASESESDESDESADEAKTKKVPVKTPRKIKDPNAPKLPMSAFFFHVGEKREQLKNDHPDWNSMQVTKHLAELWKDMPESERAIFQAKADAERERFAKEKAEYEAKNQGKKIFYKHF